MAADGLYRLPRETDGGLDGLLLPHRLPGCREALAGQGAATQDRPSPPRRALVYRVAAQPQAAGGWRPIKWQRSMSERERAQFAAQKRVWSSVLSFSFCSVDWRFLDQMASVPGLPPAIQELVELLGGVFR